MGLSKDALGIVYDYAHQLRFSRCLRELKQKYRAHRVHVDTITRHIFRTHFAFQFHFDPEDDETDDPEAFQELVHECFLEDIKETLYRDWIRTGTILRQARVFDHTQKQLPSHVRALHDCYRKSSLEYFLAHCDDDWWEDYPFERRGFWQQHTTRTSAAVSAAMKAFDTTRNWFPLPQVHHFPTCTFWMCKGVEELLCARDSYNPVTKKFTTKWLNSKQHVSDFKTFYRLYDRKQQRITHMKHWKLKRTRRDHN